MTSWRFLSCLAGIEDKMVDFFKLVKIYVTFYRSNYDTALSVNAWGLVRSIGLSRIFNIALSRWLHFNFC